MLHAWAVWKVKLMKYQARYENDTRELEAYASKAEARRSINPDLNPVLVRVNIGGVEHYDAFPQGYPIPRNVEMIEYVVAKRWRKVKPNWRNYIGERLPSGYDRADAVKS